MVFSSLLFLFGLLAPQLLVYFLIKNITYRNVVLLFFSLVFYAWGGPRYLILLAFEAFVAWFTAKELHRTVSPKYRKAWLILACVILFGLLMVFKYTGFFFSNLQALCGWPKEVPNVVLPIGISFYTFQLVSYVADVYRREVEAQPRYWKILLYASLFHQCIAGPIVRYQTVAEEIDHRTVTGRDVAYGIRRFAIGLAKKAILANGCAAVADQVLLKTGAEMMSISTANAWIGIIAYTMQIYLDFSAYSDMAIGMGRMVGFHYLENFDYPYTAHTVQNFWRRWHISLSTFFRDYVYIPLGGNRKGNARTIFNMFVVWFLTGMWHGASWNYILWGLYFFVFLMIERLFLGKVLEKNKFSRGIGHLYTIFVVIIGWVLFKFTDLGAVGETLKALFGSGHPLTSIDSKSLLLNNLFFLIFAVIACLPIGKKIREKFYGFAGSHNMPGLATFGYFVNAILPAILIVLSVLALVGNSYNPFLYFQF